MVKTFRLVNSPMLRARHTAEHIRILHPKVVPEVVDGLWEFEPFDFSHLPALQPAERRPLMASYWADCDAERIGDGLRAESFARFRHRVELALADLQSSNVDVLAVCHGGEIKLAELLFEAMSSRLNSRAMMKAWIARATIQNCGLRHFSFKTDSVTQGVHNVGPPTSG